MVKQLKRKLLKTRQEKFTSGKFSEHPVAALDCYTAIRKCPALAFKKKKKLSSHCSEGKGFQGKEMAHS